MDLTKILVDAATQGGPGFALAVTVALVAFATGIVGTSKAADARLNDAQKGYEREVAAERRRADEYKAMYDEWAPRFDALLDLVEASVRTRRRD